MEELAKSDVFFFITGIAVIILTIMMGAILFYIIKIVRNVKDVSDRVKEEGKNIVEDVAFFRKGVEKTGKKVSKVINDKISSK